MALQTVIGVAVASMLAPCAAAYIPLFFEQNQGQTDRRVDFLSRGGGYVLFLTRGDAVLKLKDRSIRMHLPGARREVRAAGLSPQRGRSNYLRGGDRSFDVTSAAQYGQVRYKGIYPGIDLVYYGKDGHLEYDFVVAPGADPSHIRLKFEGAPSLRLDHEGNLRLGDGVRFDKPVLYQEEHGKRIEVQGAFRLRGHEATFQVGSYRRDLPLVIDPVLTYSTYLGGAGDDQIRAIAVDAAGNAYIGGDTTSADFPVTTGAFDTTLGSRDMFVAKLNPGGSALIYATYIGVQGSDDVLTGLDVTPDGRVVVIGQSGIDPTAGAFTQCCGSHVAVRLNAAGTAAEYVSRIGVPASAVKALSDGSTLIGATLPSFSEATTTPGAYQRTHQSDDGYVLKLNTSGTAAVFATYLGGAGIDALTDIATDDSGNIFIVGTAGADFPTTPGAYQNAGSGFAAKLKSDGSALIYSTLLAGASPQRLAAGTGGEIWIAGMSPGNLTTTPGAYLPVCGFCSFLVRLNSAGTATIYSTYTASVLYSPPMVDVAVDSAGEAFLVTNLTGPTTANAFQPHQGGIYIQRFSASGSILRYATYHGSASATVGGVALDTTGKLYVAGSTTAPDMPATPGALQTAHKSGWEGFIAKIDNANISCSYTLTPASAAVTATAATGTVGVNANSGCSWVATTADAWISIPSGASGIGSGTLNYNVAANHSTSPRTGSITIAGQTFSINQAGSSCTYSIAPTSLSFDPSGGISNLAVTAPSGCNWTVSSNVPWITTVTTNGSGNSTVQYSVTLNTGASRTGTLTVAGQTFTVTQAGLGCVYTLSSSTQNAPIAGGSYSFSVTAPAGCPWTPSSNASWIVVTSGAGGPGNGTVQYTVQANTGTQRQGTISVGGQTFTVTQAAASACAVTAAPAAINVPAAGGLYSVAVTTGAGCAWTVNSLPAWITANSGSGTGSGNASLTIATNSGAARSVTIQIGNHAITVTQQAAGGCVYTLGSSTVSVVSSGVSGSLAIATGATCAWTASSDKSWVQVYPLSGTGPGTLSYTVFPNYTAASRTASINVMGQTFAITQAPATGTADERFVGEMYFAAFGRIASSAEIAGHIASGRTRPELVNIFLNVPEFTNGAKFVAGLYVGILGRDAEYGGWMFQRNAMAQSGATPHGLVSNFLNSAEFASKYGVLTNAEFVRLLYRQVLGREASQAEVDFQVTNLKSRVNLAVAFLTSEEYKARVGPRLTGFLLHALLLQRDPAKAELDARAAQIAGGTPLTTIIGEMMP